MLYHLSDKKYLKKLTPRVPECIISGHEDAFIRRICCASKIGYCLKSLSPYTGEKLYVYKILTNKHTCILKSSQIECVVRDAVWTHECWILNPVDVELVGLIQVTDSGGYDQFVNKFGDQFTGTFGIKWVWLNKYTKKP